MKGNSMKKSPSALGAALRNDDPAIREMIARKAYELFEKRGYQHGHHEEDWMEAERIVISQLQPVSELGPKPPARSTVRNATQRRQAPRR